MRSDPRQGSSAPRNAREECNVLLNQTVTEDARAEFEAILRNLPMTPAVSTSPVEAPWLVVIRWECVERDYADKYIAVGVLISRKHVLTVAHLNDMRFPVPEGMEGEPRLNERHYFIRTSAAQGGRRHEISGWFTAAYAPDYDESVTRVDNRVNDIQILELAEETSIEPIRLAEAAPAVGTAVSLFGQLADQDNPMQVDSVVIDPVAGKPGRLGADELVVANVDGDVRLGPGFSGGPVVVTGADGQPELVGIVNRGSMGFGDDYPMPGIFADVAVAHRPFIAEVLDQGSS